MPHEVTARRYQSVFVDVEPRGRVETKVRLSEKERLTTGAYTCQAGASLTTDDSQETHAVADH